MFRESPFPMYDHWSQQSPIRIHQDHSYFVPALADPGYLRFEYDEPSYRGTFEGEAGHKNFVLDDPTGGANSPAITFGKLRAELRKIHLHTPSEHDLEGKNHAGEIHLLHEIIGDFEKPPLLVLGTIFQLDTHAAKGKRHPAFELWLAPQKGAAKKARTINLHKLLPPEVGIPPQRNWYLYEGSLTSDPYTENVTWIVFQGMLKIDSASLKLLRKHAHQPERPPRPLNRRFVLRNFQ